MNVRRILKASTIICIVLAPLVFVYARPLSLLLAAKRRARTAPELWIVPKPLTDTSIERSAGRKFSCFGYQFEVPWTDVKQEKNSKSMDIIHFANDTVVIFFDPAQRADLLEELTQQGTKNESALKNILPDEATRSNYSLRSTILYLTPRDLRLFSSRREMVSNSVLLMLKPMWADAKKGG